MSTRYIFVSGGVLSGLGKGLITSSLGLLLKNHGYNITPIKCENYLNVDAGLINPIEHGDTFLCEDGTETDMDIGAYERFLDKNLTRENFITMGQVYKAVIDKERNFGYGGEDVEAIPHVTDEIIRRIKGLGKKDKSDIVIIELGGTAGEYQNALYYEASRIMDLKYDDIVIHIHVGYLPTPRHLGEPKTKPTQLSVRVLNSMGIQPDFVVARSNEPMDERRKERFALFCNMSKEDIINAPNVDCIYEMPLVLQKQEMGIKVLKKLDLSVHRKTFNKNFINWKKLVKKIRDPNLKKVNIAIVGKYFATGKYELQDSYRALLEALKHAGWANGADVKIHYINSEKSIGKEKKFLKNMDGVIVPIGWGPRGVPGMIKAITFARKNKIPYLGLCYGMQLAVVEFARNVSKLKNAHTEEVMLKTPHPVIHFIPEQKRKIKLKAYGGTMRLGAWECKVKKGTYAFKIYKNGLISERHRHRYEVNDKYVPELEKKGLIIGGRSLKENLVELIELPKTIHPFFLGTQGHPEYKSRPLNPHPIFVEFIKAAKSR